MMMEAVRAVEALSGKDVFVVAPSSSGVGYSKRLPADSLVTPVSTMQSSEVTHSGL
jgi:hypothetical protein